MRFLLPAIGIAALVVTGTALQTLSSNDVAMAETTLGVPVYEIQANANYVKTLPEQEIPLPWRGPWSTGEWPTAGAAWCVSIASASAPSERANNRTACHRATSFLCRLALLVALDSGPVTFEFRPGDICHE